MKEGHCKCAEAKAIIQSWLDKQGHEKCWYYPELFRELATLFDLKPTVEPALPPRNEFKEGCSRYEEEIYIVEGFNNLCQTVDDIGKAMKRK